MHIVKRILSAIAYFIGILILLLLVLTVLSQTQFFKDRVRTILVSTLSQQINGGVQLGTIRGDFITGLDIDSVKLFYGDSLCISTGAIHLVYDPLALLEKKIAVKEASIEHPQVHFFRPVAGEWNFVQLFQSSEDTSTPAPFDWTVTVDYLKITHGSVSLLDSLSLTASDHDTSSPQFLEFHNFNADNITIALRATYQQNDLDVRIDSISFSSQTPHFQLIKLRGNLHTSDAGIEINNLTLLTDRSSLIINGKVNGTNLLNGFDLEKMETDSTSLRFTADPLDVADLKTFLDPVYFLEGIVSLDLDVTGLFGELAIRKLNVRTYSTNFNISGVLINLHKPENLALDVYIENSTLGLGDAAKLLPPFGIPRFPNADDASFTAHYLGKPLDFSATVSLKGNFGGLDLNGSLKLNTDKPEYSIKYSTADFNLAPIIEDSSLLSSLSTKGEITGKGFSPSDMIANLKVEIDSAEIRHTTLTQSEIGIHAENGEFDISLLLRGPEMNLTMETTLDFSDPNEQRFETEFSLYSIDLEKIFSSREFQSDISGSGTVSGSGASLSNLSLMADITLDPSTIQSFTSDEEHILINLDQRRAHSRHLSFQTSLADLDVAGKFDIGFLVQTFPRFIGALEHSISAHLQPADSTISTSTSPVIIGDNHQEYDFTYQVSVKNLEKLSAIIGKLPFNGYGTMEGSVRGTQKELSFSSKAIINELFIGNIKKGLLIDKGELFANLENMTLENTLQSLSGRTSFRANALVYNQTQIDSVSALLEIDKGTGIFNCNGILDSVYGVSSALVVSATPSTYSFTVPRLTITKDSYVIRNTDTLECILTEHKLNIRNAEFEVDSALIAFNGTIGDSEDTDVQITLKNFDVRNFKHWSDNPKTAESLENIGGTLDGTMSVTQDLDAPVILTSIVGKNIHYKQTFLGSSIATLYYAKEMAHLDIKVKKNVEDIDPYISLIGTLPINLSLDAEKERFPDKNQRLQITSNAFELNLLEPLLSDFDQMSGTITCDMLITGTPQTPVYTGTLSINDGKFLFLPNYVRYTLSGSLEPKDDKIVLKDFFLQSAQEENIHTEASLSGTLTMKDFHIEAFDINLKGDILLMTEATRRRLKTMYGTLHTSTDESGLHITGSTEQPHLEGTLRIKEATLVLPQKKEFSSGSSLLLPPVIIDDTTKIHQKQMSFIEQYYTLPDTLNDTTTIEKFVSESPILSRLRYNLIVETEGETQIRMIFSQATNEELYAELDGRVNAVNTSGTPSIYGQISVLNHSYYNFLKRFEATGKLKFIGQWDNPELDIDATFRGTRITPVQPKLPATGSESKQTSSTEQNVFVYLDITGTRYQPRLEMSVKIEEEPGKEPVDYTGGRGGDVQSDAISFILTGKFRDDLTSSDKENIAASWGTTAGTGLTSTFLSTVLTKFLQKEFSFIRSAELTYKGGNLQEAADLRLSGVAGKGYWRFGGKIFNNLGNANVSYQLSLGEMLSAPSIRNLFIELERKVEGAETIEESRKLTNTARMYYRFSF
jgi:hypothetical protein